MPEAKSEMLAVYVDGETKTGKGAASVAIASSLKESGLKVYYDVAGDFYRRFVALVRQNLGLSETDELPSGIELEVAARKVYETKQPYDNELELGDLQRPAISRSVAILGALPLAQQAGGEWWAMTIKRAHEAGADVMVLDGRNPRSRVSENVGQTGVKVKTALDLFMTCEPREAARRTLLGNGVSDPSPAEIDEETDYVIERRSRDINRADNPFVIPQISVSFNPQKMTASEALKQSWRAGSDAQLPLTIKIDNSNLEKSEMLAAVIELAGMAVKFK